MNLLAEIMPRGWENFLPGFRFPLLTAAVSCLIVLLVTPWVIKLAHKFGAVDDPTRDERRVHSKITPRWGGIGIFAGILFAVLLVLPFAYPTKPFPPYLIALLVAGIVLVIAGALDDLYQYSAKIQLAYMVILGIGIQFAFDPIGRIQVQGFSWGGQWIEFGWVGIPLTAIYLFVVSKTMDTIDGIDGLASGIATIAATTLGIIATLSGQPRVALVAMAIAGASLGFLRYNYHPAKIFMGTGGAQTLGFLLAALSIVGAMKTAAAVALIVPLLVFGIPIFDAFFVVTRRLLSRTPLTQPDKRHVHHTLLGQGFTQRQTVWILYLVAIALSGVVLFLVRTWG